MRHIFDKQAIPSNKMMIEEENIDLTWAEMAIVSFANGCAQSKFLSMCKTVCVRVNGCGIEDKQQVNIARVWGVEGPLFVSGHRAKEYDRLNLWVTSNHRLRNVGDCGGCD